MAEAMTKREDLAQAAYERWRTPDDDPWVDLSNRERSAFFGMVDAILAELRVPSEAMLDAGEETFVPSYTGTPCSTPGGVWQAMIDAVGK